MDLNSVTLLEVCQAAHGSQVACCLTTGEFLFATQDAPRYFDCVAAGDLFGRNMCEFLVPYDLEKLQDYMRAQSPSGVVSNEVAARLTMMIRLVGTGRALWIRMKTVPLSLRLMRCIDSVLLFKPLCHYFADASCFLVREQDLARIYSLPEHTTGQAADCACSGLASSNDDLSLWRKRNSYRAPLELKSGDLAMSPSSPSGIVCGSDECSLSSLAFEADWSHEAGTSFGGWPSHNTL